MFSTEHLINREVRIIKGVCKGQTGRIAQVWMSAAALPFRIRFTEGGKAVGFNADEFTLIEE